MRYLASTIHYNIKSFNQCNFKQCSAVFERMRKYYIVEHPETFSWDVYLWPTQVNDWLVACDVFNVISKRIVDHAKNS